MILSYSVSKPSNSCSPICEFINEKNVMIGSTFCKECKYYNGEVGEGTIHASGIGTIHALDCTFKNKKVKSKKKNCIWIMEKTIDGGKTWWAFCGTYFPTKKSCIFSTRDHEPFTKNSLHKIRPTKYISSK